MKLAIAYLAIPALVSAMVALYTYLKLGNDASSASLLFLIGYPFYAAPFLGWAMLHHWLKPSALILHCGYAGATLALAAICAVWLLPADRSGLALQWMAYWPLAFVLTAGGAGMGAVVKKLRDL